MEQNKKIIWINLAILLTYTIIIQYASEVQYDHQHKSLFVLVYSMYAIIAHLGLNLILTIGYYFKEDKDKGNAFLLSSLIILLVGFSSCWGSLFLEELL
jgi:hypothetical protein